MASSKLSDSDKQVILELYRDSEETTTSLAERYGVSTSTISRVLKQLLSPEDYSRLIRQKRGGRVEGAPEPGEVPTQATSELEGATLTPVESGELPTSLGEPELPPALGETPEALPDSPEPRRVVAPIRRRRTAAAEPPPEAIAAPLHAAPAPPLADPDNSAMGPEDDLEDAPEDDLAVAASPWPDPRDRPVLQGDDPEGDDYGEDEDDENDDDEEGLDGDWPSAPSLERAQGELEILPFASASLERPFYLVIDRASELITCPLKDFTELGGIPSEEEQSPTLPVFENQRLARRFSRSQLNRIIKLPDGQLLKKTQPYLEAKGITRLLIEGQVYALAGATDQAPGQNGEEVPAL